MPDQLLEKKFDLKQILVGGLVTVLIAFFSASYGGWLQTKQNERKTLMELRINVLRDYAKAADATYNEADVSINNMERIATKLARAEERKAPPEEIQKILDEFTEESDRLHANMNRSSADLKAQTVVASILFKQSFTPKQSQSGVYSSKMNAKEMVGVIGRIREAVRLQRVQHDQFISAMSAFVSQEYMPQIPEERN